MTSYLLVKESNVEEIKGGKDKKERIVTIFPLLMRAEINDVDNTM